MWKLALLAGSVLSFAATDALAVSRSVRKACREPISRTKRRATTRSDSSRGGSIRSRIEADGRVDRCGPLP